MDTIKQAYLTGERALFHASDVQVEDSTFAQGESPLKESRNIRLHNSIFKWKDVYKRQECTCHAGGTS